MMLQSAVRQLPKQAGLSRALPSASVLCHQLVAFDHYQHVHGASFQAQQKRTLFGKTLYNLARGVMPPISKTEQVALGCGTIGTLSILGMSFNDKMSLLRTYTSNNIALVWN
jgi:hypothetical protein